MIGAKQSSTAFKSSAVRTLMDSMTGIKKCSQALTFFLDCLYVLLWDILWEFNTFKGIYVYHYEQTRFQIFTILHLYKSQYICSNRCSKATFCQRRLKNNSSSLANIDYRVPTGKDQHWLRSSYWKGQCPPPS